jgi:hypothetical protein
MITLPLVAGRAPAVARVYCVHVQAVETRDPVISRFALARSLLLLPVVLAACSTPPSAPRAILDEHSGLTINAVSAPLLFGRIHRDVKSAARDYVTLVAAEADNAGKYTQLFLMYRWSRSFDGQASQPEQNVGTLVVVADGREIVMEPLDRMPIDLGDNKDLFLPASYLTAKYAYLTNFETMRAIASSHELSVKLPKEHDAPDTPFSLLGDGRAALAQLVSQLNGS